ncbi:MULTISPECIES: hypothetical protein [Haloarcula]|uniref:hypothetical protein n=1 Tax=Haloarcula TaxID=2237 RepID=UPI0023E82A44|nr:hypothetical protein [Halomicroarcula sp. SHR3]
MYNSKQLRTWYSKLTDAVTLRRLEATAHVASWVAVSMTALMVGTGMATETNPVSRWLIETLGMRGWGVLAALLVSGLYRLLHRYANRRWAAVPASALVLNALTDAWAVSQSLLPEGVIWAELASTSLIVGLVALACYGRFDRLIWSALGTVEIRQLAKTSLAIGIVLTTVAVPVANYASVGQVGASSDETVFEDFEDDPLLGSWTGDTDASEWKAETDDPLEGDRSLRYEAGAYQRIEYDNLNSESLSFRIKADDVSKSPNAKQVSIWGSGGYLLTSVGIIDGDITLELPDTVNYPLVEAESDVPYIVTITSTGDSTFDAEVVRADTGETIASEDGFSTRDSGVSDIAEFRVGGDGASFTIDKFATGDSVNTGSSSEDKKEVSVSVDDQTEQNLFENPSTARFSSDTDPISNQFNGDDKISASLEKETYYGLTVRSESGAVWETQYQFRGKYYPSDLTIKPGGPRQKVIGNTTEEGIKPHLTRINDSQNNLTDGNSTGVGFSTDEEVTNVNLEIKNDTGSVVYNETREFDDPTSYYETEIPSNATNGTAADEGWTFDYSGEYENGSTFEGSTGFDGESASGFIGPTGSDGGGGSPVVGVVLVGGVGYLAYRRFGNGQLGNAVSSAARRLRP